MWCCTKTDESYREMVITDVDVTTNRFGLSTLHAWIRFLECLLHTSYRLEIKEWQVGGDDKQVTKYEEEKKKSNPFQQLNSSFGQ
jgi:hypothetical protein